MASMRQAAGRLGQQSYYYKGELNEDNKIYTTHKKEKTKLIIKEKMIKLNHNNSLLNSRYHIGIPALLRKLNESQLTQHT